MAQQRLALSIAALLTIATTDAAPGSISVHAGHPCPSPDGKQIAFDSDRSGDDQIYILSLGDGSVRQVSSLPGDKTTPQWSADGRRVYFSVADEKGSSTVYAADANGQHTEKVAVIPGRGVRISPSGQLVSYFAGSFQNAWLETARLDGRDRKRLTGDSIAPVYVGWWSPDETMLAFAATVDGALNIWTVDRNGANAKQATHFTKEQGRAEWPAWAPDGRSLVVQVGKSVDAHAFSSLWRIDMTSGAATNISPHNALYADETPAWFPDGKQIVFQSDRSGAFELWLANRDGTNQRRLTT
jgi:TolB protein